ACFTEDRRMDRTVRAGDSPDVWRMPALPAWLSNLAWTAAGLGLLALIWTAVALKLDNPVLLPTPAVVLGGFYDLLSDGLLLKDILASLKRVFVGFLIAAAAGVPLAMVLAYFVPLRRLILPIVSLIRPIPPIAWIPIAIL